MRRPLAAMVLGAVSLAGLVPAAGAAELPFFNRKPALKLGCKVVGQDDDAPAVACRWSTPRRPGDTNPEVVPPAITFELRRGGGGAGRTVVYSGPDTSFTDTSVEPGGHYAYRAGIVRPDTRRKVHSRVVVVHISRTDGSGVDPVPAPAPKPPTTDPTVKPAPAPRPKPAPAPAPKPVSEPAPKPLPVPDPTPQPVPVPKPELRPAPVPVPKPTPQPAPAPVPKPAPAIARLKLACAPQRTATADTTDGTTKDSTAVAPTGPAVVCEWAAPAELKVAGFQLWRAERPDGTKQVVFKSADPGDMKTGRYLDRAVSSGHSYVYVVRALDANGRVIGQSDAVTVAFPA